MAKPGGGTGGGGSGTAIRGTTGPDLWDIYQITNGILANFLKITWDGRGGSDTFDFSGFSTGMFVAMPGSIESRVSIEQGLIGTPWSMLGSSTIQGVVSNTFKNVENVIGGSGNDILWGGGPQAGSYVNGGAGNDWVSTGSNTDATVLDIGVGGDGEDWVDVFGGIAVGGDWDRDFNNLPTRIGEPGYIYDR